MMQMYGWITMLILSILPSCFIYGWRIAYITFNIHFIRQVKFVLHEIRLPLTAELNVLSDLV